MKPAQKHQFLNMRCIATVFLTCCLLLVEAARADDPSPHSVEKFLKRPGAMLSGYIVGMKSCKTECEGDFILVSDTKRSKPQSQVLLWTKNSGAFRKGVLYRFHVRPLLKPVLKTYGAEAELLSIQKSSHALP